LNADGHTMNDTRVTFVVIVSSCKYVTEKAIITILRICYYLLLYFYEEIITYLLIPIYCQTYLQTTINV
jgi:hypothetical protein